MSSNGQLQPCFAKLSQINEQTWLQMGAAAELMQDYERAMSAYEAALRHNSYSITALSSIAALYRGREQFPRAVEYFQRILNIDQNNGEIWGALGHCYLMMDDLQKAYSAYQQALYHLPNPKEPKLWYGIGILYDRYGSLDHAEEAFSQVMRMEPKFEKANEIYFRLGIIYKQQQKYEQSLDCFKYILRNPPRPLTEVDIWFQIGHVHEQQKNFAAAKEAYERVLADNPTHAKVLQQLGWLYHQQSATFSNQDSAISYLTKSLESGKWCIMTILFFMTLIYFQISWYLLGRCYMAQQKYNKAYEAYQQAVYRDGRNPTFWCSIGVLYYQINQFRDALDAYSRAIRLNPYISEVWYDLGTLYESCNNQISDALDAYQRAAELDPTNPHIKQRLQMLRTQQAQGGQTSAPIPQDVNPQAYQSNNGPSQMPPFAQPSPGPQGPPGMPNYGGRSVDNRQNHPPIPLHNSGDSHRDLPPVNRRSPGPSNPYGHPPSHLRDPNPSTPPNHILNPLMSPHDQRPLTPHQPPPLRHNPDKRTSPSPQLPQIQEDRRPPRHSPQLPETYQPRPNFPSPRMPMTEHGNSQHSSYPHSSHHEFPPPHHSTTVVDHGRESDMYDHGKGKPEERNGNGVPPYHSSEPLPSAHESLSHHSGREYRDSLDSIIKANDSHRPVDHSRTPVTRPIVDHNDPRMQEGSIDEKGIPPFSSYHPDEHQRRLPEIKNPDPPSQRQAHSESPVRESSSYANDQHSPVSNIPVGETPRKSSADQHSSRPEISRELHKIPYPDESSPTEPRSPNLSRIMDNNNNSNSPTSPLENDNKPVVLPAMRTTPSVNERSSVSNSARQVDEDYDGTAPVDSLPSIGDGGASTSSAAQKRSYSPKGDDLDDRRDEGTAKRIKPSPRDEAQSPISTHSEREREQQERDREQRQRERRKSEQSANGGSTTHSPRSTP
ncbi:11164_t:CDS:10 [Acaulospora morrowiae]|uniref:11164_t:CDS:1 n=1 Tax=Acaulospora morrowiae TaxID=94023 RepID=A0A9N9CPK6_9GLOM|nr:11164_t:CDS:10 [Acaulospora morrowiae]